MTPVVLKAPNGLHARPANQVVQEANKFQATVHVIKDNRNYNAKSIIALMSAGFIMGETIFIQAEGTDACEAEAALAQLIATIID